LFFTPLFYIVLKCRTGRGHWLLDEKTKIWRFPLFAFGLWEGSACISTFSKSFPESFLMTLDFSTFLSF
jgi:hypothetical protein